MSFDMNHFQNRRKQMKSEFEKKQSKFLRYGIASAIFSILIWGGLIAGLIYGGLYAYRYYNNSTKAKESCYSRVVDAGYSLETSKKICAMGNSTMYRCLNAIKKKKPCK